MANRIKLEALDRINHIAWEDHVEAKTVLQRIQAVLYEMEQIIDKQTEASHGSDQYPLHDEQSDYPNMRRA
jgi:hypothetical protein